MTRPLGHHVRRALRRVPFEAAAWTAGLLLLAFTDPAAEPLARVCPFAWLGRALGLEFCPGCGLGHAVAWLFRGDLVRSWAAHPLGVPAVALLLHRIATLVWRARSSSFPDGPHPPVSA